MEEIETRAFLYMGLVKRKGNMYKSGPGRQELGQFVFGNWAEEAAAAASRGGYMQEKEELYFIINHVKELKLNIVRLVDPRDVFSFPWWINRL